jgi:probable addiction module antidote protein
MDKSEQKFMNKYSDEEIAESFLNAWTDGDPDDIKSALYAIMKRFGATHVATSTGIPRTTLYDMCKDDSNPTLDNLCRILEFARGELAA